MNNTHKIKLWIDFSIHILMLIIGFVMVVSPGGATVLITKIVGWALVGVGAVRLISKAMQNQPIEVMDWIVNGLAIALGVTLLVWPLLLSRFIGRAFGILLLFGSFRSLRSGKPGWLDAVSTVVGLVLLLVPQTLTNVVFVLCGVALLVIGLVNLLRTLDQIRALDNGDPNIIDAEN